MIPSASSRSRQVRTVRSDRQVRGHGRERAAAVGSGMVGQSHEHEAAFLGPDQDAQACVQADEGGARPALVEHHRLRPQRLTRLVRREDDVEVRGLPSRARV
jgi:hypothetical protein